MANLPGPGESLPGEQPPLPNYNNPPFWHGDPDNRRPIEPTDSRLTSEQNNVYYDNCSDPNPPDPTQWTCDPCKRHDKDNLATLGIIDNLLELRNYILRKLGSPVICIELSTEQLNDVIMDAVAINPTPTDKGKRLKIFYATQVAVKPPTFVVFVNEEELMHFSYMRFLENQIRKAFVFEGTPIHLIARKRK